jgi:acetyl esterase/lipase
LLRIGHDPILPYPDQISHPTRHLRTLTRVSAHPRGVLSRPAPPPDRTLAYGTGPDQVLDIRLPPDQVLDVRLPPDQVLDVRLPPGVPDRPLVVFLHGGFWRAAWDRRHAGPLAADLAARGYPMACLEYRRTGQPDGGWPGTFDDVLAGVTAAPRLLGIPGPPVLAGHSAGGQLALWAATRVPTAGVLALAPVADLTAAYRLGLDGDAVAALLGGAPERVPERYAATDPARLEPPPVPTVLVHGTRDAQVPVELSRVYARRAGDRVRLVELAGVEHFGLIDPLGAAWPTVVDALATLGARA